MIQPIFNRIRLLANILLFLSLLDRCCFLQQSLLFLGCCFGLVFGEKLEGLRGGVAVEHIVELGDRGRDFEAEVKDLALALQAHIFGPFYHAREVTAGLDSLADAEVARAFFDERVLSVN